MPLNIILIVAMVGVTIYLLQKDVNLGIIMLFNAVMLVIIKKIELMTAVKMGISGLISNRSIKVILVLFLIMMLENVMRKTGMISALVFNIKELVGSNRFAAVLMPFVLGLLASAGGARFSCPMVEETVSENGDPETKAFINYWFRHAWLDAFILYPGMILAAELLNTSVFYLFAHMIPFIAIAFILGIIFGVGKIKNEKIIRTQPVLASAKLFSKNILPVVGLIVIYILLLSFKYALEVSTLTVLVILLVVKKYSWKQTWETAKEAFSPKYILIIGGVMIFNEVLSGSGVLYDLQYAITNYGIPKELVYLILPIVAGMLTGMAIGFTSMSFPLLISIGLGENIWLGALAFTAGMIGQMITPMHICLIMTSDYFKVNLNKFLKRIIIAIAPLFIIVALGFIIIS